MTKQVKTLKALANSFNEIRADDLDSLWAYAQKAQSALDEAADELEMRAIDRFEQKIVNASWRLIDGAPLKDFLDDSEIEEAIKRLADIYTALGRSPTIQVGQTPIATKHDQTDTKAMNTIEQKELTASFEVRDRAYVFASHYTQNDDDIEASTLALLWAAFEQEALSQGLSQWRGVVLGNDTAEES